MNQEHYDKLTKEGVDAWNKWRHDNPGIVPDLSDAPLQGADLDLASLQNADLRRAVLTGARLIAANLKGAFLDDADLRKAKLYDTHLEGADLFGVKLQKADLELAHLESAKLLNAKLEGARLTGADLRNADVYQVKYDKLGECLGIRLNGCYGSPRLIRDAKDNEFIEEVKDNHPVWHFLWSISSDCGRSLSLWIGWSLFLAIYFGLTFFLMGPDSFVVDHLPFDLITMLYYSVVTFTTLGFGDIKPLTQGAALWVMAEVIVGYIMLGGLISILATKLARRSA